jgi:GT2 family glycosyltransferase
MISVVVPLKDEPPAALEALQRLAASSGAELLVASGAGTRGARLAEAAGRARGDSLLFVHADSRPPERALALIHDCLSRGAAAGAFSLRYEPEDARMRWIAWWANRRARLFGVVFGDQGIFCRRDAYLAAGGFRDLPVCEDIDLVRRLRRVGPFVILPEATATSPRRYRERGALRQVLRVWKVLAGYYLGVRPATLADWYER